jgi:CheY-like chemotaxis protein
MSTPRPAVLVIDDEEDMVDMIAFGLSQRGYEVHKATSGFKAVELARAQRLDVAVSDLKMPGMDGIQTTIALKQVTPGLDVVLATGFATEETVSACKSSGVSECIRKPFTLEELESLLQRILAQRTQRRPT